MVFRRRSFSFFVTDNLVSIDLSKTISLQSIGNMLDEGSFFSVFPNVYSYDVVTDDPMNEGILRVLMFLHSEGIKVRFWYDLSIPESLVLQLNSYVSHWGFFCPTFHVNNYQESMGSHTFMDAQSKLDRFLSEGIHAFLHMPLYAYLLDDLPEWVDFILRYHYLTFFHYQKHDLLSSQRRSVHYFEQFLPVFVLPLTRPYVSSDRCLPVHISSNFESLFWWASCRKSMRRIRLSLGI